MQQLADSTRWLGRPRALQLCMHWQVHRSQITMLSMESNLTHIAIHAIRAYIKPGMARRVRPLGVDCPDCSFSLVTGFFSVATSRRPRHSPGNFDRKAQRCLISSRVLVAADCQLAPCSSVTLVA